MIVYNNIMNEENEILQELHEKHPIDEMVKFSDLNIQEKLMENPFQIVKYKELYYHELSKLDELIILQDKLNGERYKYYRFEDDKEWTKVEIEKYCLPTDIKVIQMKRIIEKQKVRVRFFEIAYKAFEKMQWSMKGFIDTLRSGL